MTLKVAVSCDCRECDALVPIASPELRPEGWSQGLGQDWCEECGSCEHHGQR